jgi:hypothetical protein
MILLMGFSNVKKNFLPKIVSIFIFSWSIVLSSTGKGWED